MTVVLSRDIEFKLRYYASRFHFQHVDTDDLMQEAMLRVAAAGVPPENKGLCYVIGKRAIVDAVRLVTGREGQRMLVNTIISLNDTVRGQTTEYIETFAAPEATSDKQEGDELADIIFRYMSSPDWSQPKRDVFYWNLEGVLQDEMATRLGVSPTRVCQIMREVRNALANHLRLQGYDVDFDTRRM